MFTVQTEAQERRGLEKVDPRGGGISIECLLGRKVREKLRRWWSQLLLGGKKEKKSYLKLPIKEKYCKKKNISRNVIGQANSRMCTYTNLSHVNIVYWFFLIFLIFIFIYLSAQVLVRHWGSSTFVETCRIFLVVACKIFSCSMWDLVPWAGIKPRPPALGVWSLSHWTTREAPVYEF